MDVDYIINKHKKCPECNNDLIFIWKGFPRKSDGEKLKNAGIQYILGGCCGWNWDDRDPEYLCKNCKKLFNSEYKEIDKCVNNTKRKLKLMQKNSLVYRELFKNPWFLKTNEFVNKKKKEELLKRYTVNELSKIEKKLKYKHEMTLDELINIKNKIICILNNWSINEKQLYDEEIEIYLKKYKNKAVLLKFKDIFMDLIELIDERNYEIKLGITQLCSTTINNSNFERIVAFIDNEKNKRKYPMLENALKMISFYIISDGIGNALIGNTDENIKYIRVYEKKVRQLNYEWIQSFRKNRIGGN